MKRFVFCITVMSVCYSSYGDFDYTISDEYRNSTLTLDDQSVQITGAGVKEILAYGDSYVEVIDTLPLQAGIGGVRMLNLYGRSEALVKGGEFDGFLAHDGSALNMYGGSMVDAGFRDASTVFVSGGRLSGVSFHETAAFQFAGGHLRWLNICDEATAVFSGGSIETIVSRQHSDLTKHITFVCDVKSVQRAGGILSGNWLDGSAFSIALEDRPGFDSTYSNIQFIPEPTTLLLFGLGTILLRRRRA